MEPFIACLTFTTPLILNAPLTLDAIVVGELAIMVGDEAAIADMPLARTDGVPHASQAFLQSSGWTVEVVKVAMRGSEPGSAPLKEISDNSRSGGGRIVLAKKHENSLNTYTAEAVGRAYFAGVGLVEPVRHLLEDARAIGKRRADGMGLIADVSVEAYDADPRRWGLAGADGDPVRPVPIDTWLRIGGSADPMVQAVRARPFYWDARNPVEACAVPSHASADRLLHSLELGS